MTRAINRALPSSSNFSVRPNGAVFLGICGGYQLLGNYYKPSEMEEIRGLGLLDIVTHASNKRMIGNLLVESDKNLNIGQNLIGFENHSGKTFLGKRAKPIGKVLSGFGNNGDDRTEGAYEGKVFGSYLHGPLLPKNPQFTDYLITLALNKTDREVRLEKLEDRAEERAHLAAIRRTKY